MTNYSLGDFLIRLKNASMADLKTVTMRRTKLIKSVAEVLVKENILGSITEEGENITVSMGRYKKQAVLMDIKLVSKPGLRIYMKIADLKKHRGISWYILSTPFGIMSSKQAIKKSVGGEVLAEIW